MSDRLFVLGQPSVEGREVEHDQAVEVWVAGYESGPNHDPVAYGQVDDRPRRRVRLEALRAQDGWELGGIGCRGLRVGGRGRAAYVPVRDGIDRHDPPRLPDQDAVTGIKGGRRRCRHIARMRTGTDSKASCGTLLARKCLMRRAMLQ